MDANQELINELQTGSKDLSKGLTDVNKDLKSVLKKMRSPGKLMMDVTLVVILSVLIGVLVWTSRRFFFSG